LSPSVLLVSQPTTEGVARCVADLAAAQCARGWPVTVASPRSGWLAEQAAAVGADHVEWSARRSPGPWVATETARLGRVIDATAPDVVHLFSSKAGLAGRLAIRGRRPTLFQPEGWSFAVGGTIATVARSWEKRGARWTDVLVCCSQAEYEAARGAGIEGPAEVVPNAVDLEAFRAATGRDRDAARTLLGLADGPLVVCVGRLSPQKGQDLLLDAWPLIRERVPKATLALVGDGPDRQNLERRRVAGVEFFGRRSDVSDWLAAADVIAFPSRYEGMSIALLEAMARGRSVVAYDVEGMAEALTPPERFPGGAVVAVGDTAGFAAAIVTRLVDRDLAAAEEAAARRLAEENHDLGSWGERLCGITERVAARSEVRR
jgi:glycosyltransferase involved in cell wall biosynthesis